MFEVTQPFLPVKGWDEDLKIECFHSKTHSLAICVPLDLMLEHRVKNLSKWWMVSVVKNFENLTLGIVEVGLLYSILNCNLWDTSPCNGQCSGKQN